MLDSIKEYVDHSMEMMNETIKYLSSYKESWKMEKYRCFVQSVGRREPCDKRGGRTVGPYEEGVYRMKTHESECRRSRQSKGIQEAQHQD